MTQLFLVVSKLESRINDGDKETEIRLVQAADKDEAEDKFRTNLWGQEKHPAWPYREYTYVYPVIE